MKEFLQKMLGRNSQDDEIVPHPVYPGMYVKESYLNNSGQGNPTMSSPYQSVTKFDDMDAKFKSKFEWLHDPTKGVRWDFNPMLTRNLAQDDTWVEMLVQNISKEVANTPWQIVENDSPEVQKQYDDNNPFERVSKGISAKAADGEKAQRARKLMRKPNPDQDFTDFHIELTADELEIGSMTVINMFSKRDYSGDELVANDPTLLHMKASMPETFTKDYHGKTGIVEGFWQYEKNNRTANTRTGRVEPQFFDKKEIAWKDINPRTNRRYGMPPTLMVRDWLMLMDLTTEQEKRYWSRGAFPAGFLKSNGDINEIQALKGEMDEGRGKPEKQIMHIEDPDAEWVQMGLNWKELEMNEREEWYAKIISSAFQVPTSVVGVKPEDVNRATFEAERGNFESNTLGPYLQRRERFINRNIIWRFFGEDIRFEFKPGMSESQRQQISDRVRNEFMENLITRNEARTQLGYSELDEEMDGFQDDLVDDPSGDDALQLNVNGESKSVEEIKKEKKEALLEDSVKVMDGKGGEAVDYEKGDTPWKDFLQDLTDKGGIVFEFYRDNLNVFPEDAISSHDTRFYVRGLDQETVEKVIDEHDAVRDDLLVQVKKDVEGKPFGPWESFEDCVNEMQEDQDYSEEEAKRICGSLEAELKCPECDNKVPDDNKKFCSKECYNEHLSNKKKVDEKDEDEPLRESSDWHLFSVQPSEVEEFEKEIRSDVESVWREVSSHDRINELIEQFAEDETEKSSAELRRLLKDIIKNAALSQGIKETVAAFTGDKVLDELAEIQDETDVDVNEDAVLQRIQDRDMSFADDYAKRFESEIRDTVSEGWQEEKTIEQIRDDLQDKAEDFTDNQAERIARTELQRSAEEARNEFAKQTDKIEVWLSTNDDRTRPAHEEMGDIGAWKRPHENWVVEYERAGSEVEENTPGSSQYGINCRCTTILRDPEEVIDNDEFTHRGK